MAFPTMWPKQFDLIFDYLRMIDTCGNIEFSYELHASASVAFYVNEYARNEHGWSH